jgi:hypothetical protein
MTLVGSRLAEPGTGGSRPGGCARPGTVAFLTLIPESRPRHNRGAVQKREMTKNHGILQSWASFQRF